MEGKMSIITAIQGPLSYHGTHLLVSTPKQQLRWCHQKKAYQFNKTRISFHLFLSVTAVSALVLSSAALFFSSATAWYPLLLSSFTAHFPLLLSSSAFFQLLLCFYFYLFHLLLRLFQLLLHALQLLIQPPNLLLVFC